MHVSIIDQAPLRLVTARSESFPDGNKEAMASIESQLENLKGRRFYGLAYASEEGIDYYAGMVPRDPEEERRFVDRGFAVKEIGGGACARVKLHDWSSRIAEIGPIFGALIREYGVDSSRPQIEFYRSMKELHLLLPIPASHPYRSQATFLHIR